MDSIHRFVRKYENYKINGKKIPQTSHVSEDDYSMQMWKA